MGINIDLSHNAGTLNVDATTSEAATKSFSFQWTVSNGNWSVNPARTDATGESQGSWVRGYSQTSLDTTAGGTGDVTVEVFAYDEGGVQVDYASEALSIQV